MGGIRSRSHDKQVQPVSTASHSDLAIMPVLRSSKGQQSIEKAFSRDSRALLTAKRTNPISRSSSSRISHSKRTKKKKEAFGPSKPVPDNEVIEITSDSGDDSSPDKPTSWTVIHNLRKEMEQLKDENAKQRCDLENYKQKLSGAKLIVDASKIEEILNCEICTGRMWSPSLLSDCGHCFCQTCLQDWFRTILNKFLANIGPTLPNQGLQLQPLLSNNPGLLARFSAFNAPRPQYSCPTCRGIITTRPTEVYTLKALVQTLASAAGDKSPPKQHNNYNKRAVVSPWDQFFPPTIGRA